MPSFSLRCWFLVGCAGLCLPLPLWAAPSVADALKLKPVQPEVPFDMPKGAELKQCTIKHVKSSASWVIRKPGGELLRRFSDSDKDNVVDTWSYFRNGLEIYRDVDGNFNGKADQYRWFHGAGMRWAIDSDEDGKIDSWKLISAEEVAEEVVAALEANDPQRFQRLLLSGSELKKLGLGEALGKGVAGRLRAAPAGFRKLATSKDVGAELEFRDFGGLKPGMVPSGAQGTSRDLLVYENVWAMVRLGEKFEQLQLGTMINLKGAWKLIDGPTWGDSTEVAGGLFFPGAGVGGSTAGTAVIGEQDSEKMQEVLADLEKLDQRLMQASGKEKQQLNKQRASLLQQLVSVATTAAERGQWLRQLADMVSAATQDGSFPGGVDYLAKLEARLEKEGQSDDLLGYVQFQRMVAEYYGVTLANPDVEYAKAHAQWLKDLETFVEDHPRNANCAEALRQLASGSEISGESERAVGWYRQILEDYPQSIHAPMAKGAIFRLTSVGRPIRLQGKSVQGGAVDLARLTGKAVVIHYWTASNNACKADHAVLGNLYKKYGRRGLEIIGVNLDYARKDLLAYLEETRLPWPQLYEEGGFESRFAQEMGVVSVPLMILVGPDGKVVNDGIESAEIEDALKKLELRQAKR